MAYKRYFYINGKKYGPYYYQSYRDETGKTKKKYVTRDAVKVNNKTFTPASFSNKWLVFLFIAIFLLSLLFLIFLNSNINEKLVGFAINQNISEGVINAETIVETFNTDSIDLNIKQPINSGLLGVREPITKNKNKRMDFQLENGNLRLYFDLLNYSEFVENIANLDSSIYSSSNKISSSSVIGISGNAVLDLNETITKESNETNIESINQTNITDSTDLNNIENQTNESDGTILEIPETQTENPQTNIQNINEIKETADSLTKKEIEEIADNSIISAENFDINVNTSKINNKTPEYKWGYKVKLNDLKFMAKIDVTSNQTISVYNNYSLRIGRNLLSFADLEKQGYKIRFETPNLEIPINLTINIPKENLTIIKNITEKENFTIANVTGINETIGNINETNITIPVSNVSINKTIPDIIETNKTLEINATEKIKFPEQENITEEPSQPATEQIPIETTPTETIPSEQQITKEEAKEEKQQQKETKTEIKEDKKNSETSVEQPAEQIPAKTIIKVPIETTPTETSPTETSLTGQIIKFIKLTGKAIALSGKAIVGFAGKVVGVTENITEISDIKYNNTITVYIERDFTDTDKKVGNIIELDPTLIIIPISNAEHLDEKRSYVNNIYESTKELDGNWSEEIGINQFVRAYFSKNLTKNNDITIYAKSTKNNSADISVYRQDSDEEIARFTNISGENYYKVYLNNLNEGESNKVFDLKVLDNPVSFDYIVDPAGSYNISFIAPTPENNTRQTSTNVIINISIGNAADLSELKYNWNGTNYTLYNDSLVLMMNFDNLSALGENSTKVVDMSKYGNNGTVTNAVLNTTNCKFGNCYTFSGSNSYIKVSKADITGGSGTGINETFALWIKASVGAVDGIFESGNALQDSSPDRYLQLMATGTIRALPCNACYTAATTTTLSAGNWSFIVWTRNGSTSKIYFNGVQEVNSECAATCTMGPELHIGIGYSDSITGNIDNFMIYNRTLSASEIQQLYISNLQKYNQTQWYLYVNQSKNATTGLDYGTYTYQTFATDTSNNLNSTDLRTIILQSDITYPIFSNYLDNNASLAGSGTGLFNVTLSNTNGTVWLSINGTNYTASNVTANVYNVSVVGLLNGTYSYNWSSYGNGSSHNFNISDTRSYTVNVSVYPQVNFTALTSSNGTLTTNTSVIINVSIVKGTNDINEVKYNWNGTNYTLYNDSLVLMYNFDNLSSLGENSTKVVDVSKYGNNGTVSGAVINSSSGKYGWGSYFDGSSNYVKATGVTDASTIHTIEFWANSRDSTSASKYIFDIQTGRILIGWGSDTAGQIGIYDGAWRLFGNSPSPNVWHHLIFVLDGSTSKMKMYLDGSQYGSELDYTPHAIGGAVSIGSRYSMDSYYFPGLVDEVRIWNRSLTANESYQHYISNLNKFNSTQWYLYVNQSKNATTGLDVGTYTYFASAKDLSGNENMTETRYITIASDLTPPAINITYPINGTIYFDINVSIFNFTYNDSSSGYCWYSNNSGIWNSSAVSNGTGYLNASSLEGINNWTIYCNDSSGNLNSSMVIFTKIDIPRINFTSSSIPNGTSTINNSISINISISEGSLNSVNWNWNGTNYTIYNDSLILMYNFDNLSSLGENSTKVADVSKYGNNGTASGAVWNSSGKFGGAYQFNGSSSYISIGNLNFIPTTYTYSLWGKRNTIPSSYQVLLSSGGNGAQNGLWIYENGNIGFGDGNGAWSTWNSIWTDKTNFHYIVVSVPATGSSSSPRLYFDGVDKGTISVSTLGAFNNLIIGKWSGYASNYFNGSIDEVRIWNRSLTADEVYQQYTSNLNKFNQTQWYLYVNQSKNSTTGLDAGTYTYFASAKDSSSNENMTEIRYITIASDLTPPAINITYPINGTIYSDINVSILNFTYNDSSSGYCWYSNNSGIWNSSAISNGTGYLNASSLEGINNWTIYCNDSSGNLNSSRVIFTKIDIPRINFTFSSIPNATSTTNTSIVVNVSISEANLNEVKYNWNGTNFTIYNNSLVLMMGFDNNSAIGENSTYVVDVSKYGNNGTVSGAVWNSSGKFGGGYQFDGVNNYMSVSSLGNIGITSVSFWINEISTNTFAYLFDARASGGTGYLYWQNSDNGLYASGGTIYIDGVPSSTLNENAWHYVTINGLTINAAVDLKIGSKNNLYVGEFHNGTIDSVQIWNRSLSASEVYQLYASNLQKFNSTQWYLNINQSKNATTGLDVGTYTYFASAKDVAGNENMTETRIVTITGADVTSPAITITAPENNSNFNTTIIEFNATGNENLSWCGLSIDNSANVTMTLNSSLQGTNYTNSSMNQGNHNFTITCNDTSNNYGTSSRYFLYVDNVYPNVTIVSPLNNGNYNATLLFNISSSESGTGMIVPDLDSSLVSWWRMDDLNSTGGVIDYMGRNNGTNVGANQTSAGKFGKGMRFDGVNDYVEILNSASLNTTNYITINFWVKLPDVPASYGMMVSKSYTTEYAIMTNSNTRQVRFDINPFYYYGYNTLITDDLVPANNWTMITGLFNGTNGIIYFNGVVKKIGIAVTGSMATTTNNLRLGINPAGNYPFNGTIDEVMIFNRSLTASEIVSLYNATRISHSSISLADGLHTLNAYTQDLGGNVNSSGRINFSVDGTYPQINFTSPTLANATATTNTSFIVNVSISEANLNEVKYNWNGTNFTMYNDSLVLMMNFENLSALGENATYVVDVSKYGNNGTAVGGAFANLTGGKYGGGAQLDGVNDEISILDPHYSSTGNFTISTWAKPADINQQGGIVSYREPSGSYHQFAMIIAGGAFNPPAGKKFGAVWYPGYAAKVTDNNIADGNWHHFIAVFEYGKGITLYVDGINVSQTYEGGANSWSPLTNSRPIKIGSVNTLFFFNGSIDSVQIWNRSLSASEISQLYMSNLQKYNSTQWYLYVNQSKNATTGLDVGTYTYFASAKDVAGNENVSEMRTITVSSQPDTISPQINFTYPTLANETSTTNTSIVVNVSSNENLSSCLLNWQYNDILGDGSDGALTVSSANTIVNNYTYLNLNESSGDNIVNVNDSSIFSAGDEILIIQIQNFSGGISGRYEFKSISSVSGNDLTLASALSNSYYSGAFNQTNATITQIVRVPQYTNIDINSGASITSSSWNGFNGGIVVFRANGILNVSGVINASAKGLRGGNQYNSAVYVTGQQGESIKGLGIGPETSSTEDNANMWGANIGGGGGGGQTINSGDSTGGGGGGGGYATNGTKCTYTDYGNRCGDAGGTYGSANLNEIYLGSGGGAGGTDDGHGGNGAGKGGAGGGIIFIFANQINISGSVISIGENGYSCTAGWEDGSGGSGSGGTIYLYSANNLTAGTNLINASGGTGPNCCYGGPANKGGDGGNGRIRLDYSYLSGITTPGSYSNSLNYLMTVNNFDSLTWANYTLNNLNIGNYIYYAWCNDTAGNKNQTEERIVNITSSADTTYPIFSTNATNIANNSQYNSGLNYQFNITILNTNGTTGIEFNGTNYTISNLTANVYNKTFATLEVGIYSYYFWSYGNGTSHLFNKSSIYSYTIVQNNSYNLSIIGTNPIIYPNQAGISNSSCPTQIICNLYRNDTGVIISPDNTILGVGYYNYTFNTTGNENYTAKSDSFVLNVQINNSAIVYTYLNHSRANITIANNTAIWLNSSLFNVTGTISLYKDGTLINSGMNNVSNLTSFNATGLYNITTIYSGNENYTRASETWWVNVTAGAVAISIDLSTKLNSQINWSFASLPVSNQGSDGNNEAGISEYYINISVEGGTADLYIKANDNLMTSGGDILGLSNETYSYNSTNSSVPSAQKFSLTTNYADNKIGDVLSDKSVVYLKFFLNAPAGQAAGTYNNSVMFQVVSHGQLP